ncbi:MAG: hypothetical protein V4492_07570, partial [Chlamydiota bacterium]
MHRYLKTALKCLAGAAALVGIKFFCDFQTKGFRPYLILSNLPNDPRWEVPALSEDEQKTVLKFYKHSHLLPSTIRREFSYEKLLLRAAPWPENAPYFQEFNFKSCVLMYQEAKERTGLLYVHLNKT